MSPPPLAGFSFPPGNAVRRPLAVELDLAQLFQ
jgi:hypothetical protein